MDHLFALTLMFTNCLLIVAASTPMVSTYESHKVTDESTTATATTGFLTSSPTPTSTSADQSVICHNMTIKASAANITQTERRTVTCSQNYKCFVATLIEAERFTIQWSCVPEDNCSNLCNATFSNGFNNDSCKGFCCVGDLCNVVGFAEELSQTTTGASTGFASTSSYSATARTDFTIVLSSNATVTEKVTETTSTVLPTTPGSAALPGSRISPTREATTSRAPAILGNLFRNEMFLVAILSASVTALLIAIAGIICHSCKRLTKKKQPRGQIVNEIPSTNPRAENAVELDHGYYVFTNDPRQSAKSTDCDYITPETYPSNATERQDGRIVTSFDNLAYTQTQFEGAESQYVSVGHQQAASSSGTLRCLRPISGLFIDGEHGYQYQVPCKKEPDLDYEVLHKGDADLDYEVLHKGEADLDYEVPHKNEVDLDYEVPHKNDADLDYEIPNKTEADSVYEVPIKR